METEKRATCPKRIGLVHDWQDAHLASTTVGTRESYEATHTAFRRLALHESQHDCGPIERPSYWPGGNRLKRRDHDD